MQVAVDHRSWGCFWCSSTVASCQLSSWSGNRCWSCCRTFVWWGSTSVIQIGPGFALAEANISSNSGHTVGQHQLDGSAGQCATCGGSIQSVGTSTHVVLTWAVVWSATNFHAYHAKRESGGAPATPKRTVTPATQKQRRSRGAPATPKRTSAPLQCHQVPRLPRKSSGRAAEPQRRQSVHQTPCSATKSHACKSNGRAAELGLQSIHQTPCHQVPRLTQKSQAV